MSMYERPGDGNGTEGPGRETAVRPRSEHRPAGEAWRELDQVVRELRDDIEHSCD